MKQIKIFLHRVFCPVMLPVIVALVTVLPGGRAVAQGNSGFGISPVHIPVSYQADERLFLVRILEQLYETWPENATNAVDFDLMTAAQRKTAIRLREYLLRSGLDQDLARLFQEYIDCLNAYRAFLENAAVIEAMQDIEKIREHLDSGVGALEIGGSVYMGIGKLNKLSLFKVTAISVAVGGLAYLIDAWRADQAQERAKQEAIAAEWRRVQDSIIAAKMNAIDISGKLGIRYGWGRGEAGFQLSDQTANMVREMAERRDVAGLLQFAGQEIRVRPRDPFARINRNILASMDQNATSQSILLAADDCIKAASLVPASAVYDDFRFYCVINGAALAFQARLGEIMRGVEAAGATRAGWYAVSLWRKAYELSPQDATGEIREHFAFSLLGVNQLDHALKYANEVYELRKHNRMYNYNYACLMSRMGYTEKALQFLTQAIGLGFSDIAHAIADPDLKNLRSWETGAFEELTAVNWKWWVTDDWLDDDILLANHSKFPLTNVRLAVRLEKGARVKTVDLQCERIMPGETCRWEDVVAGPVGHWDETSTATLQCDQLPPEL